MKVPNLVGLSPSEAASMLAKAGLKPGSQKEVLSDAATGHKVVRQTPRAGTEARPGDPVGITVGSVSRQHSGAAVREPRPAGARKPGEVVLCERRSFIEAVFTPFGIFAVVFGILSFGVVFLIFVWAHYAQPQRVWIHDDRLFSDKKLPNGGVPLGSVRPRLQHFSFVLIPLMTWLYIDFHGDDGKQRSFRLSSMSYGKAGLNSALAAFGYSGM